MPYLRAACAFAFLTAAVACSGGSDAPPVDATVDAPIDAPIDGPPPCNGMVCDGVCKDTTTNEQTCGDCTTRCRAGEGCANSTCACAPPGFVIADPAFIQDTVVASAMLPNTSIGIGPYFANEIEVLIIAMPNDAVLDMAYPLSGDTPGLPPFIGAGYDVNPATMAFAAAFYATGGTVTFTKKCTGGFAGHADNLTFTAASGLMPPMLITNDCAFAGPTLPLAFAIGNVCP